MSSNQKRFSNLTRREFPNSSRGEQLKLEVIAHMEATGWEVVRETTHPAPAEADSARAAPESDAPAKSHGHKNGKTIVLFQKER